jgi:two-component system cell cycle sensor histidine kinase/response regulator CckA
VSDTGTGMTEETKRRALDPFFTTKEPGKGTGLGLSTVYGIVKQSGAGIAVRSAPGEGTTFEIYFPRASADEVRTPAPVAPALGGDETILVVEDDPRVRQIAVRLLRRGGYRVLQASGLAEAADLARTEPGTLHLLLTDVVMPENGGATVARRIRELRPGVRILYMSGFARDAMGRQGLPEEGVALLPKPFTADSLLAAVRSALDAT